MTWWQTSKPSATDGKSVTILSGLRSRLFYGPMAALSLALTNCAPPQPTASNGQLPQGSSNAEAAQTTQTALFQQERPLPVCDSKLAGRMLFLKSEKAFYICNPGDWDQLGINGTDGKDAKQTLMVFKDASRNDCKAGGKILYAVTDSDGDGKPSDNEISSATSNIFCNPENQITSIADATQVACPTGGKTVSMGVDLNGNGRLDADDPEENKTLKNFNICNGERGLAGAIGRTGATGTNGKDGFNTITKIKNIIYNSAVCPWYPPRQYYSQFDYMMGRVNIAAQPYIFISAPDINKNGILDEAEESSGNFTLLCPGAKDLASQVQTVTQAEAAPSNKQFIATGKTGNELGKVELKLEKGSPEASVTALYLSRCLPNVQSPKETPICEPVKSWTTEEELKFPISYTDTSATPGVVYSYKFEGRTSIATFERQIDGLKAFITPGAEKCWASSLETPEYVACKAAGKIYNRIQKTCVELGITRKTDCSDIPAQALADAKAMILQALPDSYPAVDQCGTYTSGGMQYLVAFIMGKKFSDTGGSGSYQTQIRTICLAPGGSSTTCDDRSLKLSDPPPSSTQLNCN